jgi:hypothetical protein
MYANKANKGCKQVVFEPGDWVWMHMCNKRFPSQRKNMLHLQGYGPFQILKSINDNAYKVDLSSKYGVSSTFNVSDLTLFDISDEDSRSNHFKERGDDDDHPNTTHRHTINPLDVPSGPITRARTKRLKETLNELD